MPELPEVETVRQGLRPVLEGRTLTHVRANRPDLRFPIPENLSEAMTGRRVLRIDRRAKYLLMRLEGGLVFILHLGMSGRVLIFHGTPPPEEKHDHLVFQTDGGVTIRYNDARRFGSADLVGDNALSQHPMLASLGPEPLGDDFTGTVLSAAVKGKNTPIKAALLDQRVVAGIGNIYACEALFRSGISPKRLAKTIKGAKADRLVAAIKQVLTDAIAAGGSTLRDHRLPTGELGYFQHTFRVYDQEGEACPTCGPATTATIKRLVQSGRSTFYCSRCQR